MALGWIGEIWLVEALMTMTLNVIVIRASMSQMSPKYHSHSKCLYGVQLTLEVLPDNTRSHQPFWLTSSGHHGETVALITRENVKKACQHCTCWSPSTIRCYHIYRANDYQFRVLYNIEDGPLEGWHKGQYVNLYINLACHESAVLMLIFWCYRWKLHSGFGGQYHACWCTGS